MQVRLRDLREDRDLKQGYIAAYIHMSQSAYARYEKGGDIPMSVLIKLADFYNVSVDYLLGRTDEERAPAK